MGIIYSSETLLIKQPFILTRILDIFRRNNAIAILGRVATVQLVGKNKESTSESVNDHGPTYLSLVLYKLFESSFPRSLAFWFCPLEWPSEVQMWGRDENRVERNAGQS